MRPTFDQTVSVLVKAYLNDTLINGNCEACAVGNLIFASGGKLSKMNDEYTYWLRVVKAKNRFWPTDLSRDESVIGNAQIASTGYTTDEIDRIEKAFEDAPISSNDDEWNYNGLMAVVDVLAEIHSIDLSQKEEAKKLFIKA